MREVLAFVVAGAPAEQRTSFDARLERRRLPQFKRLGRLHIVVAVNEKVFAAVASRRARDEDWIAGRGVQLRFETDGAAVRQQPLAARLHVAAVLLRLCRHAGEPNVLAKLLNELRLVVPEVS